MRKKIMALGFLLVFLNLALPGFANEDYRLGPEDEIEIRVWSHDDLTRKVRVGLNGDISFPFVGEIKAQGMSVQTLQREIEQRLGPKYIIDPRVSITVTEYKSQKFFVVGSVNKPGTYPLTKPIRVVEALSLAGGLESGTGAKGSTGSAVAIIVRAKPGERRNQPVLPDQTPGGDKLQVSLSAAMAGDPKNNLEIKNGDTIYVPALFFYVQGQVKNCGRYPYEEHMTVLMAITTAGGFTDKASKRALIVREKNGKKEEIKAKMDDAVQPGDVVTVPESWF
jgi:polysaccharide biosynthesis/export protein